MKKIQLMAWETASKKVKDLIVFLQQVRKVEFIL